MATGFRDIRRQKFVDGIAAGKNQGDAARDAGYSAKTADSQASRLLKNVKIRAAVDRFKAKAQNKAIITAAEVLVELKRIAMVDLKQIVNPDGSMKSIHDIPVDVRRAICAVELDAAGKPKYKLNDKNRALELLGKHLKLYTDVVEHHGLEGLADRMAAGAEKADELKG